MHPISPRQSRHSLPLLSHISLFLFGLHSATSLLHISFPLPSPDPATPSRHRPYLRRTSKRFCVVLRSRLSRIPTRYLSQPSFALPPAAYSLSSLPHFRQLACLIGPLGKKASTQESALDCPRIRTNNTVFTQREFARVPSIA